ncbi:MAG: 4-(cytidine 5'-diphospho)-2-C-methyl-D-erythritol kinase [Candidatus Eremiobacteraeota bacterium]|nr:4-(cytidine 5'-diphospho)-2-C-methyl-D-erythritol kinase [Candidatus Eremiobacteraeota bacterium]
MLKAPAKLNLTLEVLSRREDGLHNLRSLMVPIDLHDQISIRPNESGFFFDCDRPDLTANNLVVRTLDALELSSMEMIVRLQKAIPTGAGLGGGSSDAAAILLAAIHGVFGPLPEKDYVEIAHRLGSDVPFFLCCTGALVEGTGQRVTAVGELPQWHALIVKPPVSVSTAQAYAKLDRRQLEQRPRSGSISLQALEALQRAEFDRLDALLMNDFQTAEIAPQIGQALAALRSAGAAHPIMSGSGSCVFALATERAQIDRWAGSLTLPSDYEIFCSAFAHDPAWVSAC